MAYSEPGPFGSAPKRFTIGRICAPKASAAVVLLLEPSVSAAPFCAVLVLIAAPFWARSRNWLGPEATKSAT
jgi:hypothetical protein